MKKSLQEAAEEFREAWDNFIHEVAKALGIYRLLNWMVNHMTICRLCGVRYGHKRNCPLRVYYDLVKNRRKQ